MFVDLEQLVLVQLEKGLYILLLISEYFLITRCSLIWSNWSFFSWKRASILLLISEYFLIT
jgi:hypothetical protein